MNERGRLGQRFARLAFLNILANVTIPLAGLIDTAILGRLPEFRTLGGVALASLVFDYLYFGLGFLRMSTTGATAQAAGAGDRREASHWLYRGALLAAVLGAGILALSPVIERVAFAVLSGEAPVEAAGRDYFRARIWGAPATLFNMVVIGWLLGRERSGRVLALTALANSTNIVLDYWLVLRLGLGASGAGWATALSQWAATGLALALIIASGDLLPLERRRLLHRQRLRRLAALNANIFVRTLCLITAFALFSNFSAKLGTAVLAANALLLRIVDLAAFLIDGVAYAMESLTGFLHGARRRRELAALLRTALLSAFVFGSVILMPALLARSFVFGLLTRHEELVDAAARLAPWLAPTILLGAVAYVLDGFFLGLTAGRTLRNAMIASTAGVFLPLVLLALYLESPAWLWASLAALMLARATTLAWPARRYLVGGASGSEP